MMIYLPVLLIPRNQMDMESHYYIFLTISRQLRMMYFFVIIMPYYENDKQDDEVEKQMRRISITLLLMIFVTSGIFVEIENSQAVIGIEKRDCI